MAKSGFRDIIMGKTQEDRSVYDVTMLMDTLNDKQKKYASVWANSNNVVFIKTKFRRKLHNKDKSRSLRLISDILKTVLCNKVQKFKNVNSFFRQIKH
jgi:hypothetical protein